MKSPHKNQRLRFVLWALVLGLSGARGFEHFVERRGPLLMDGNQTFRFVSFNIPNLLCIEDNFAFRERNPWRLPNSYEIEDALCTIAKLGGTVARTYVLTVRRADDPPGTPRHVLAPGKFSEEAFLVMDTVLVKAAEYGVRLIIPFIDNWHWMGGIGEYAAFRGKPRAAFWTDPQLQADFRQTIAYVLNRRNTITGILYREDKAILAWELGNELREAPLEWITEMAAFVKSIDKSHLLNDGIQTQVIRPEIIADPNIDILSTHHYEPDARITIDNVRRNCTKIAGTKPYYLGEFGFFDLPGTAAIIDTVLGSWPIAGALLWSLRFHNRDGGFYWHSEPGGKSLFKAYHYPGFPTAAIYNEEALLRLMSQKAWEIRGLRPPAISVPLAPRLLPIQDVTRISWQGVVGAVDYVVERAEDVNSWQVVAQSVCDADYGYEPLFNDRTAEIGKAYYYRVKAHNATGLSSASNVVGPVIVKQLALIDHLQDGSQIYALKGRGAFKTNDSRSFKEDLHRLAVEAGSEVIYQLPGQLTELRLFYFVPKDSGRVEVAASTDGERFYRLTLQQAEYTPQNYDYPFWRAFLTTARNESPEASYVKITFSQKCQIGKVEIYYVK